MRPKRWIVERTFAGLMRYRLANNYETTAASGFGWIHASMIHLTVRRRGIAVQLGVPAPTSARRLDSGRPIAVGAVGRRRQLRALARTHDFQSTLDSTLNSHHRLSPLASTLNPHHRLSTRALDRR